LSDRPGPTTRAFPPAAAWWTDAAGAFVAFSPRWEELTGRELAKELGSGWLDGVHPDDLAVWERTYRAALASHSEFHCDLRLRSGSRWACLRMHGLPQRDRAGAFCGFVGSATDVSDLKRAVSEQGEVLHAAVHDLRAPLRNLGHLLEQLTAGDADPGSLARVRGLVRSLEQLLRDLLEYSAAGGSAARVQSVDPAEAFAWARANLAPLIVRQRAEIELGPLPRVRVDPIHLGRVFQNLLSNALCYCGEGPPRVRVDAEREADVVCFAVRDRGVGIPAESHEAIFRAFQRLSGGDVPGTGLGLAICRRLVETHGGRIWVDSRPGSGATFYFTLPAAD
jgi:PAS domain S-box-containing protein